MRDSKKTAVIYLIILTSVTILILPLITFGEEGDLQTEVPESKLSLTEFLNPDKWFDILKRNITIPISKEKAVSILTPEKAIKQSSPQLREIGRGVREETGIDLAKFIGWMAKVLKIFFLFIINILELVARSFN